MFPTLQDDEIYSRLRKLWQVPDETSPASLDALLVATLFGTGIMRTHLDFLEPFLIASNSFWEEEKRKFPATPMAENLLDYAALMQFNAQIAGTGARVSQIQMSEYYRRESLRFTRALFNTLWGDGGETIGEYWADKVAVFQKLVISYPDAIRDIGDDYGFHPEHGGYLLAAETPRMRLYQVLPTDPGVEVRNESKPILICHPYVLGRNIIVFLPKERKSYAHAFANQGIPTYIRIVRDIQTTEPVQVMTGEDDARDTAEMCRLLKEKHGKPVTLNGFCQGGFIVLADLLSGELDGLVDTLITCVAPVDGTRSKGLVEYLQHIAPRFRSLDYAKKLLPNGNEVIDGHVMSWVYKLKSIWREAPLFTFFRDINLFEHMEQRGIEDVGSTAAAINHWLLYDKTDLPVAITQMSFDSYTIPISRQGDLPFKLFDRRLNFDYIREKGIKFQICFASKDDLVDPPAALAPIDFIECELAEFPKGHAAIATSWSYPESEYALHKDFPRGQRGPVRLQLDLDQDLS